MKHTQKGGILLWLIVLVIILGGAVYIKSLKQQIADLQNAQMTVSSAQPAATQQAAQTAPQCGLIVASPQKNTSVRFPLTVTGKVDNTSSNCTWGMFEGQAGIVSVYVQKNGQWVPLFAGGIPVKVADWTARATTFTVTIAPDAGAVAQLTSGTPLMLRFMSENASGDPAHDRFIDYPVSY